MGWLSSLFGGDESAHDVKSSSEKSYDNGTRVTTFGNSDGSKTEVVNYNDKDGYPHIVISDTDSSGNYSGHTTGHGNPNDGIESHQHGSHKD